VETKIPRDITRKSKIGYGYLYIPDGGKEKKLL
jgi:hypothetical protein